MQDLPEPLEPRAWRSPLGWLAISLGVALFLLGIIRGDVEPMFAGALLVVLAVLSQYWLPGILLNWIMRSRPPPR